MKHHRNTFIAFEQFLYGFEDFFLWYTSYHNVYTGKGLCHRHELFLCDILMELSQWRLLDIFHTWNFSLLNAQFSHVSLSLQMCETTLDRVDKGFLWCLHKTVYGDWVHLVGKMSSHNWHIERVLFFHEYFCVFSNFPWRLAFCCKLCRDVGSPFDHGHNFWRRSFSNISYMLALDACVQFQLCFHKKCNCVCFRVFLLL